jgi:putative transposase
MKSLIYKGYLRRELVARPDEWLWSSYRHYQTGWKGTVEIESHWTSYERERKTNASGGDR